MKWIANSSKFSSDKSPLYDEQTCNRNGLKLIDYILYNQLKVMNTIFEHKDNHNYTWMTRNQKSIIDYAACNKKLADMVLDTGVYQGLEIELDCYLLVCPICMRPRWYKNKQLQNIETPFKVNLFRDPQHNLVI
jgi:hypothetical protein